MNLQPITLPVWKLICRREFETANDYGMPYEDDAEVEWSRDYKGFGFAWGEEHFLALYSYLMKKTKDDINTPIPPLP
jgi:hypothetical protein